MFTSHQQINTLDVPSFVDSSVILTNDINTNFQRLLELHPAYKEILIYFKTNDNYVFNINFINTINNLMKLESFTFQNIMKFGPQLNQSVMFRLIYIDTCNSPDTITLNRIKATFNKYLYVIGSTFLQVPVDQIQNRLEILSTFKVHIPQSPYVQFPSNDFYVSINSSNVGRMPFVPQPQDRICTEITNEVNRIKEAPTKIFTAKTGNVSLETPSDFLTLILEAELMLQYTILKSNSMNSIMPKPFINIDMSTLQTPKNNCQNNNDMRALVSM